MIFYFSGTGNSLFAAKNAAKHNKDELISISSAVNSGESFYEYELKDNEMIGFVFPVYAWAPPKMVLEFIENLKFKNYNNNYTFSIAVCGDNIGNTMEVLTEHLKKKGMDLNSGFSVKMPNNYIILGNVDSKELEKQKLLEADENLESINKILEQRISGVYQIEKGPLPWFLTGVISPIFNKNAVNTRKFHVNDNCNGCGICEKVCNSGTINVEEKPRWGWNCTQCLACIHYCPQKAIQYGKSTAGKGRYTNPNIKIDEMFKR
jgi:ferredoxin